MSYSNLMSQKIGLGSATVSDLFSAILTLLICLLVIKILVKICRHLLQNSRLDVRVQKYVLRGLKLLGYIITIILVIESLGVHATSLVALLSVGSLGVTLAAEDILGNVAGGLVVLSSHSFSIGDFIQSGDTSGTVEEITLNHTKLITLDGSVVLIPNKALSVSQMTNFTVLGRRRICWKVSASYDAPTEQVKDACRLALSRTEKMLADPAPSVYLTEYGSSGITYSVYCWSTPADYWDTYFSLGEQLRTAFDQRNVEMTYNHLNVHILDDARAAVPEAR